MRRLIAMLSAGVLVLAGIVLSSAPAFAAVCSDAACSSVPTSKQQVASALVDLYNADKLVIPGAYPGIFPNEIQAIANNTVQARCDVDIRALQTILIVIRHFGSATITDLNRDCSGGTDATCPGSPVHCVEGTGGAPTSAIDFGAIGGLGGPSAASASALFSFIATFVPQVNNGAWTEALCGEGAVSPYMHQFFVSGAGCDHHHIDYRGSTVALNVGTATASFDNTFSSVQSNGDLVTKTGLGSTWTTLSDGAAQVASALSPSGPVFAMRTTSGNVYSKVSVGAPWVLQTTNSVDIAIVGDATYGADLASIQSNGDLIAKTGLGAPWATLTNSAKDVSLASDPTHGLTVAAVLGSGNVITKTGIGGAWTTIVGPASAVRVASDAQFGVTYVVLSTGGSVWAKTGLNSTWTTLTSGSKSVAVASDSTHGPTIGSVQTNGDAIVKTGITGPWVTVVNDAAELAMRSDPVAGLTIVDRLTSGNVSVKSGIGGTWTGILSGSTQVDIAR